VGGVRNRVADDTAAWIENRPTRGARALDLSELWAYRELALFLALRDVKARYKQSFFGISWAVVQPLITAAIFSIVFAGLADVSTGSTPYLAFALAGSIAWGYLSSTVTAATSSTVANASLITKVYFPRILAPLAALLPGFISLGVGSAVLGAVLMVEGIVPSAWVLSLPVILGVMMLASFGPGVLMATANVRYRDIGALQGTLIQLWLIASPVGYPSTLVDETWRLAYALNPMVAPIEVFRWMILGGDLPEQMVVVSLASGVVLAVAGIYFFQRSERTFADVI
jgi:ABC-type polysaccharide/polyol phosphate export permease